jgi:hypothetical protein
MIRALVASLLLVTAAPALAAEERIAWFETWKDGVAAAQATNRPILLVAAAPQCHEISGLW